MTDLRQTLTPAQRDIVRRVLATAQPVAVSPPAPRPPAVPYGAGWDIFATSGAWGHAPWEIQADSDFPELFDNNDNRAWRHVVREAAAGGPAEVAALAFLARCSIDELRSITLYLWETR